MGNCVRELHPEAEIRRREEGKKHKTKPISKLRHNSSTSI